jgi:hypothetical protein
MKVKKVLVVSSVVVLAATCIALGTTLGVVCRKVAAFDRKHGSDVFANLSQKELLAKTNAVKMAASPINAADLSSDETIEAEMKVVQVGYEGDDELVLTLSARPDMDVVRNYVKVEPLCEG